MDNKTDVTERIKERFIIIYDKFTRPMALSLRNSIEKANETCVVWTEDVYNSNEYKLTNRNLLVLLNEKMIKVHLANPSVKTVNYSEGVILKHEGNTMGLTFDPSFDFLPVLDQREGKSKFIAYAKCLGWYIIPYLGPIIASWVGYSQPKKAKTILLFEAVNKLKTETIEKFLSGKKLG